jgi:hypothetical protein
MSNKIKIETITPANGDGNALKNYYFLPDGTGTYSFYDTNNNMIASGLSSGLSFSVPVNGLNFTITINSISDTTASGDWSDLSVEAAPGSGTFQAQAGGTIDPKPESSYEATA